MKRCRTEIASLKRENKNLVKREVSEHREKGKTSSKSSLTLAETPSIVSTVNTNSKSLPDTSWPKSPINNNSRQLVPCSKDSSPHTPSGPPPATPLTAPHSSKSLETPLYKKSNLEVIKQVGNKYDFENLLESIKMRRFPVVMNKKMITVVWILTATLTTIGKWDTNQMTENILNCLNRSWYPIILSIKLLITLSM